MKNNPYTKTVGRASQSQATGRFEKQLTTAVFDNSYYLDEADIANPKTQFFKDSSRSVLTKNDSPDLGFSYSMNFYRGCEHGCMYCYARPTHEYLGLSAGLDFETKIFVKENAPELLREAFMKRSWEPQYIMMSGATDCYQPAERKYQLTRQVLEVLREFKNPVSIITKNALVTRDIDILKDLAREGLVEVYLSVTTLDQDLSMALEPRTSVPRARLRAIELLAQAGIPVGVNVAPVIPGLTDHEMPQILKAASEAGARFSGFTMLRLPYSVSTLFIEWLEANRPLAKDKVVHYIQDLRGGKMNSADFADRMRGVGPRAEQVERLYSIFSKKYGFDRERIGLRTDLFQRPGDQLSLI